MIKKIKKHFSNYELISFYIFSTLLFISISYNDGIGEAITVFSYFAYLFSGFFVSAYILHLIGKLEYKPDVTYYISYVFYTVYSIYLLYEYGFTRKSIIIAFPILIGLFILFARLNYENVYNLEKKTIKKISTFFNKKS